MHKNIILALCILCGFGLKAQMNLPDRQAGLDSLHTVWQDQTQSDSIRASAYYDYIWSGFLFSHPDSGFVLAQSLLSFGEVRHYEKARSMAYNIMGASNFIKSEYSKALDYWQRSLKIYQEIGYQKGSASAIINIGAIYYEQGDYPKALDYYIQNLEINEQIGNQNGTAFTLGNIGLIYMHQGDYQKALEYFVQSLEISEQMGNQRGAALQISNIGLIYMHQGDYAKALDYYIQSLEINEEMSNQGAITNSLHDIGTLYFKQGDYLKALDYFTQSLEINEQMGYKSEIANSLIYIGSIYQKQGDNDKALNDCQRAYEISLSIESLERQKDACKCLYDTYKVMGNGNKALKYLELLTDIEDSLHAEETSGKLQQMEFAKEVLADSLVFAKKEALSKVELEKSENTKLALIGGSVLLMFLAAFIFYGYRQKRKANKFLKERNKFEIENKKKALTLFSQHVSPEVAKELLSDSFKSGTNKVRSCIMFLDIRNFTPFSETREPTEIIQYQNDVFGFMIDIVSKHHGIVNQFMGDGFLAMFGAPVSSGNDSQNAVEASLEILKELEARCASGKLIETKIGIGLHTGDIVTGNVGTAERMQYSITGNTVILASRIEQLNKQFNSELLISLDVLNELDMIDNLNSESLGPIELKGRSEPMEIFKLS